MAEASWEERRARYEALWRMYGGPRADFSIVRAWAEAMLAPKPAPEKGDGPSRPEPKAETWRDRPPML